MSNRALSSFAVVWCVLSSAAQAQQSEDMCRDVLEYAAHNQYRNLSTGAMRSDLSSNLCTSDIANTRSGSSSSGGITVFGYGAGNASTAANNISEIKHSYCGANASAMSNDKYDYVLQNVVDEKALEAWHSCMEHNGRGPRLLIEMAGDLAEIKVWWEADLGVQQATVTGIESDGLDPACRSWPHPGTPLTSARQIHMCHRIGSAQISYIVKTDRGDAFFYVSPPVPKAPPAPVMSAQEKFAQALRDCTSGQYAQCANIDSSPSVALKQLWMLGIQYRNANCDQQQADPAMQQQCNNTRSQLQQVMSYVR